MNTYRLTTVNKGKTKIHFRRGIDDVSHYFITHSLHFVNVEKKKKLHSVYLNKKGVNMHIYIYFQILLIIFVSHC